MAHNGNFWQAKKLSLVCFFAPTKLSALPSKQYDIVVRQAGWLRDLLGFRVDNSLRYIRPRYSSSFEHQISQIRTFETLVPLEKQQQMQRSPCKQKAIVSLPQNNFELEIITLSRTSTLDDCSQPEIQSGIGCCWWQSLYLLHGHLASLLSQQRKGKTEVIETFYRDISGSPHNFWVCPGGKQANFAQVPGQ